MRKSLILSLGLFGALYVSSGAWAQAHFLRGDSNHDTKVDISDGIATLGYLFLGSTQPPCLDAADVNDSSEIDIADAVFTFNFLFLGGAQPAAPFPVFEADPTDDDGLSCLGPPVNVAGDITTDTTWTSDKVYRLTDRLSVNSGATLTIEAGTTVLGAVGLSVEQKPVLVVLPGGKINAVGTSTHPVVFTSENPVGSRKPLDWGGIVILGRGGLNVPGGSAIVEGLPDLSYGCPDEDPQCPVTDDNSGRLSYVRIEFGGFPIFENNEVNALSLFSVGTGTQLDHIQCKFNADDGIEWFGGGASLKYGLISYVEDDMFDYSFGWRGRGQFWVGIEKGEAADNGFEVDNSESGVGTYTDIPRSMPTISNVTLIGPGDPQASGGGHGFVLRRGAGTRLYNFIMQGFKRPAFDADDDATCDMLADQSDGLPGIVFDYGVFYDNGPTGNEHWQTGDSLDDNSGSACTSQGIVEAGTHSVIATDSPTGLSKPYDLLKPDFRPAGPALENPFDPSSLDSWFEPVSYRGGVAPGNDWTKEPWVSYALE